MYSKDDVVLYGAQGICRITDLTDKMINGEKHTYYALQPVFRDNLTVFIPVDNPSLVDKMRRALTEEQIYSLIKSMPDVEPFMTDNENERREKYKQMLISGDPNELVQLIKTIYKRQRGTNGKERKQHVTDSHYMQEAEKLLYEEFAYVLHMQPDEVFSFISKHIDPDENE